jgi:alpha-amylase/alpha-mannosidase (GH57 family)
VNKARYFSEEDKQVVLDKQAEILRDIIPTYKKFILNRQIEVSVTPFYHPILPLLYNTKIAKEANLKTLLPKLNFAYPQDAQAQIDTAVRFFQDRFGVAPAGMWPSEESVSEHILPFIIQSGIKWIVTDEAILFKSRKLKIRNSHLLYQPHLLKREEGLLNIIFRDRNISDLIGFVYHEWKTESAVADIMRHLENIHKAFKGEDALVAIAMDGENAWEYYPNDGYDFLELLYRNLSDAKFIKTTTISEYLDLHPPQLQIQRLSAGSWIYANFGKWIDNPYKAKAWEYLAKARGELERAAQGGQRITDLAWKQMYICEGSDWFWWYGEDHGDFDKLFRMHLTNLYSMIGQDTPDYLKRPLTP